MRGTGKTLRSFSSLVAMFRNGSILSVADAAARLQRDPEGVRHQITELHDAGLLRITAWRRQQAGYFRVYEWAEPFGAEDAPNPVEERESEAA